MLLGDLGTEPFESLDMKVDGSCADGASAGKRNASSTASRNERSEYERGSTHGLDQFVRRFGRGQIAAGDRGPVLGATVSQLDIRSHSGEQLASGLDVAYLRNVLEHDSLFSKQSCGHGRQGGVFGATHANGAEQRVPAANNQLIHIQVIP